MKASKICVNPIDETITVSKAFYKKACAYGSNEYHALKAAKLDNPHFQLVFKEVEKKSYKGLGFERMEAYIRTQPKSKERLDEFKMIQEIAEAKGAKYALTKKWFLKTYPEYKEADIQLDKAKAPSDSANQVACVSELKKVSGL